jgi:hypothetical protein
MGAYQVAQEADNRLKYIIKTIEVSPSLDPDMRQEARQLQLQLMDLLEQFTGDPTKPRRNEPAPPGLMSRLQSIVYGHWRNTTGPTSTQRKNYEIVAEQFGELLVDLRKLVEKDLVRLERNLEKAKAPWTPGRRIPEWNRE